MIEAGANALVAGSAVFGAKDYAEGTWKKYFDCVIFIWHTLQYMEFNVILIFVMASTSL